MNILILYDYTGIMAEPWLEAGHTVYSVDGQHPEGLTSKGNWHKIGMMLEPFNHDGIIDQIESYTGPIDFVFGFPECTDLAVSGACRFKEKAAKDPLFQEKALDLALLVKSFGEFYNCPWAFENPVSVISSMFRKPNFYFHPYEYGGYLPEDDVHPLYPEYIAPRDKYRKKTGIWSGNGFVIPEKDSVGDPGGDAAQYARLGGRSKKTKNIRSATPRGFAKAVYEANK